MGQRSVHVLVDCGMVLVEHTVPLGEEETHKLWGERGGGGERVRR